MRRTRCCCRRFCRTRRRTRRINRRRLRCLHCRNLLWRRWTSQRRLRLRQRLFRSIRCCRRRLRGFRCRLRIYSQRLCHQRLQLRLGADWEASPVCLSDCRLYRRQVVWRHRASSGQCIELTCNWATLCTRISHGCSDGIGQGLQLLNGVDICACLAIHHVRQQSRLGWGVNACDTHVAVVQLCRSSTHVLIHTICRGQDGVVTIHNRLNFSCRFCCCTIHSCAI